VLFRFKTNLTLLPLPFSSSDPQSLLFSIQTEKKIHKVTTALRQSIGFCRSQNPVCKGTDHQEWLSPQYVCVCTFQHTHHRCYHLPFNGRCFISSRDYPALLSSPITLLKPYTCRSVHCASSCISSLCLGCSQSNDCQFHTSTTSIHSTDASYSQGAHSIGTSTFNTVASPHQSDCLIFSNSYSSLSSTLDYASTSSADFHGTRLRTVLL
jgi:hypothetical protein